jgi:hypothetical protein
MYPIIVYQVTLLYDCVNIHRYGVKNMNAYTVQISTETGVQLHSDHFKLRYTSTDLL